MDLDDLDNALRRWTEAGFLDEATSQRIRDFEHLGRNRGMSLRWPVYVALAIGALLVGCGLILFASSQWQRLYPVGRCALLLCVVAVLHGLGAFAKIRLPGLELAFHGLATLSLGLAILVGAQALHVEVHRAAQAFVWLVGACFTYFLVRDWLQFAFIALLAPAWAVLASQRWQPGIAVGAFLLALGFTYLSSEFLDYGTPNRIVLAWLGGLTLPIAVIVAITGLSGQGSEPWLFLAAGVPLLPAWFLRRRRVWMNCLASAWTFLFVLLALNNALILLYIWSGIAAAGLSAWGVQENHIERINIGMAGFLVTLLFFFFSNVMNRAGRSASLIILGILFLAAAWSLERIRRRLIARADAVRGSESTGRG